MYFRHYGWVVVLAGVFSVTLFGLGEASAKVWMPDGEYREYHDVNGLYTVVGVVKNSESYSVLATVKVTVADGKNTITKEHKIAGPIVKSGERPFKIKFPEVTSQDPEIKAFEITHKKTQYKKPPVEVIYDDTLVLHEDGHITGRVINLGDETVHDYSVHAIARGEDKEFLDAAQNVNKIKEIKPGEVAEFTMYPDPQFEGQVEKYSCFGGGEIGEMMVLTRELKQAGEKAVVRYIEGAAYYEPQFNKNGKEFTIVASNAYPFEVDANFEFPINSESEEIDVFFDGKPIDAL